MPEEPTPPAHPNGWPQAYVSMAAREYIDGEVTALRREVETALKAHQRDHDAHTTEHMVHAGAHEREHAASNLAITKSEEGLLLRFESHNKFREQLERQAASFVTIAQVDERSKNVDEQIRLLQVAAQHFVSRESFDDRLVGLAKKQDDIERTTERSIGRAQGVALAWGVLIAVVSVGAGLLGLR